MILLHKPFTEEVLIKKMREVLDGKSVGQDHNNPGQGGEKK